MHIVADENALVPGRNYGERIYAYALTDVNLAWVKEQGMPGDPHVFADSAKPDLVKLLSGEQNWCRHSHNTVPLLIRAAAL